MSFSRKINSISGSAWAHTLVHFHCATHLCEETPEISPDQTSLSHTPSLYPYSRAQQLGLGQTFELNTGIKSFSQHKTPQFTGSTPSLTHQPHLRLPALILKPGGGGSSHLQGRCLCHPRIFFFFFPVLGRQQFEPN